MHGTVSEPFLQDDKKRGGLVEHERMCHPFTRAPVSCFVGGWTNWGWGHATGASARPLVLVAIVQSWGDSWSELSRTPSLKCTFPVPLLLTCLCIAIVEFSSNSEEVVKQNTSNQPPETPSKSL